MNSLNMEYNSVCNCKITTQFKDMKYEYGKKSYQSKFRLLDICKGFHIVI